MSVAPVQEMADACVLTMAEEHMATLVANAEGELRVPFAVREFFFRCSTDSHRWSLAPERKRRDGACGMAKRSI